MATATVWLWLHTTLGHQLLYKETEEELQPFMASSESVKDLSSDRHWNSLN
jgi:hypothetical protein